jgi:putative lipoprotein
MTQTPPARPPRFPHATSLSTLAAAALLLAGCGGGAGNGPGEDRRMPVQSAAAYTCGDGARVEVAYDSRQAIRVLPPGGSAQRLRRVEAATGARYRAAGTAFWDRGGRATFDPADGPAMACERRDTAASWADAALSGARFRALGQEPGWIAVVRDGRVRAELDYGARVVTAPVDQVPETAGTTTWYARQRPGSLRLLAQDTLCRDVMSGHALPLTVTLVVDGRTYEGCGRWLVERGSSAASGS